MGRDDQLHQKKHYARRYHDAIEKSGEKSIDFWRSMGEDAQANFDTSSNWAGQASDTCIDMMKIGVLVGSIYIAIIKLGIGNPLPANGIGLAFAGIFLLAAEIIYIISYDKVGDIRVAGNMDRLYGLVENNSNEKEMLQSVVFDSTYYGHLNGDITRSVNRLISLGTLCLVASVGSMTVVVAL